MQTSNGLLQGVRYWTKYFIDIVSFTPDKSIIKQVMWLSYFTYKETTTESLSGHAQLIEIRS